MLEGSPHYTRQYPIDALDDIRQKWALVWGVKFGEDTGKIYHQYKSGELLPSMRRLVSIGALEKNDKTRPNEAHIVAFACINSSGADCRSSDKNSIRRFTQTRLAFSMSDLEYSRRFMTRLRMH